MARDRGGFRTLAMLAACVLASCAAPQRGSDPQGVRNFESLDTAGLLRLAGNFERAGDDEAAIGFYVRAMRSAPEDPAIPAALGNLFLIRGDMAEAEPLYMRALALEPGHAQAIAGLARLEVSTDRPKEALALLAPWHEAGRGTAATFNSEAVAHDLLGAHDAARRSYSRALLEAPEDVDILGNLALSMAVAGEYAAAHDLLDGIGERPGMAETAIENRSLVLALEGRTGEAEDMARRVQPEETVRLNRLFYRALAGLASGPERARAVFLGRLPDAMPDPALLAEAGPQDEPGPISAPAPQEAEVPEPAAAEPDLPEAEPAAPVASVPQAAPAGEVPEPLADVPADDIPADMPVDTVPAAADEATAIPAYHLQLGSFSSEERARAGMALYAGQAPELRELGAATEPTEGGEGRTLHRLLAGPVVGYSAGRAICDALADKEIPCIVIPLRPEAVALTPVE